MDKLSNLMNKNQNSLDYLKKEISRFKTPAFFNDTKKDQKKLINNSIDLKSSIKNTKQKNSDFVEQFDQQVFKFKNLSKKSESNHHKSFIENGLSSSRSPYKLNSERESYVDLKQQNKNVFINKNQSNTKSNSKNGSSKVYFNDHSDLENTINEINDKINYLNESLEEDKSRRLPNNSFQNVTNTNKPPKSARLNNFIEEIKLYNKKDHENSVVEYKGIINDLKNRNLELSVQNDTLMKLNKDLKIQLAEKNKDFMSLEEKVKQYQNKSGQNNIESIEKDQLMMKKKQETHIDQLENEIINKASIIKSLKTEIELYRKKD